MAAISVAACDGGAMRVLDAETFARPKLDEQDAKALCEELLNLAIADQGLYGVRSLMTRVAAAQKGGVA